MENDIILNIDKPAGITSCRVVERIKKSFFPSCKVGHTGTLDPAATGILLVCVGKATKRFDEFSKMEKEYCGEMTFGISTDTADNTGKVISKTDASQVKQEDVIEAFKKFEGFTEQIPPMYSALRYKGRRLYELAREGKTVERLPRRIHISEFKMLDFTCGAYPIASFRVACSGGTYVRSLAEEVGKLIGCGACLSKLVRTRIGSYLLKDSVSMERLENTLKP